MTVHCHIIVKLGAIVVSLVNVAQRGVLVVSRYSSTPSSSFVIFFCGARDEPCFLLFHYSLHFCSLRSAKYVLEVDPLLFFFLSFV
uniref:Secreted protein n=1 Tax=Rhipicephalus appendiculatus TaxID=34631 RepID=A0A131Y9S1_RHIAP